MTKRTTRALLGITIAASCAGAWSCVGDEPASQNDAGSTDDGGTTDGTTSDGSSGGDGSSPQDSGPGCVGPSSSTPGALDPLYGNSLKNVTHFAGPHAAAVDALGRVYVAGQGIDCTASGNSDLAVVRFTSTGDLDTSFNGGTSALRCYDFAPIEAAYAIAVDADGKILLGGLSGTSATGGHFFGSVIRIDASGALDPSFGNGGLADMVGLDASAPAAGGKFDVVFGLANAPGGKVVVVGGDDNGGAGGSVTGFIARLGHDGQFDTGFGTNGLYSDTNNTLYFNAAVDDAGTVAAPSRQQFSSVNQIIVTKLDATGHPATGFGTAGMAAAPSGGDNGDEAHTIVALPNGGYLTVGARDIVGGGAAIAGGAAVVFDSAGHLDSTFGTGGITSFPANIEYSYAYFSNVAVRYCTGDLFVAEQRNDGFAGFTDAAAQDTALLHLNANGQLDTSFGEGGVARAFFVGGDIPVAAVLDPTTNKVVVVSSDAAGRVGVFRFEP